MHGLTSTRVLTLDPYASNDSIGSLIEASNVIGFTTRSKSSAFTEALRLLTGHRTKAAPSVGMAEPTYELDTGLLDEVIRARMSPSRKGKPVGGIPYTDPQPEKRAMTVMNARTGQIVSTGDMGHRFSQQSMSKPTAMAHAIELMGGDDAYRQFVGVEASGRPYNAPDLLPDGRPFNSSVNAGALATWLLIVAKTPAGVDPFDLYLNKMKALTNNPNLTVNEDMATGEFEYRPQGGGKSGNQQLLEALDEAGFMTKLESLCGPLTPEAKERLVNKAFHSYCRACAVMVNTRDMAQVAAVYHNGGKRIDPETKRETQILPRQIADFVRHSNIVGGSYNESGTQLAKNNFGGKTGVDGGIFGGLEGTDIVVATHHSDLNAAGNSGEGQKWINTLSKMKLRFPNWRDKLKNNLGIGHGNTPRRLKPGELGESPREMNARLRSETPAATQAAIKRQLEELTGNDRDFYMKVPNPRKAKNPLLEARPLVKALDANGKRRIYYLAPGDHQLHKVIVMTPPRPSRPRQTITGTR